jgi:hypothetical protein
MISEVFGQFKAGLIGIAGYLITFIPFESFIDDSSIVYWTHIIEFLRTLVGLIIAICILPIFFKKPMQWIKNKLFESHLE